MGKIHVDEYVQSVIENVEYAGDELWQDELRNAVRIIEIRDSTIAALEAELEPWREMERMIGEMRDNKFWYKCVYKTGLFNDDPDKPGYMVVFRCVDGATRGDHIGIGDTRPEAVKAAYEAVIGGE